MQLWIAVVALLIIAFAAVGVSGSLGTLVEHHLKFAPAPDAEAVLKEGQVVRLETPTGPGLAKVVAVDAAGVATIAPFGITGLVPPESA